MRKRTATKKLNKKAVINLMVEKKLSRTEVAKLCGIDNSNFTFFFNDKRNPQDSFIEKLAKVLGATIEEITLDFDEYENLEEIQKLSEKYGRSYFNHARKILTPEQVEQAKADYFSGKATMFSLRQKYNVSYPILRKYLQPENINFVEKQKQLKEERRKIIAQYNDGAISKKEACRLLGIDPSKDQLFYYYKKTFRK